MHVKSIEDKVDNVKENPMPRIESQKTNKSKKTPKKAICIKTKY